VQLFYQTEKPKAQIANPFCNDSIADASHLANTSPTFMSLLAAAASASCILVEIYSLSGIVRTGSCVHSCSRRENSAVSSTSSKLSGSWIVSCARQNKTRGELLKEPQSHGTDGSTRMRNIQCAVLSVGRKRLFQLAQHVDPNIELLARDQPFDDYSVSSC